MNYNAMLISDEGSTPMIGFDRDCWRTNNKLGTANDKIEIKGIPDSIMKAGTVESIQEKCKFKSYLIKDKADNILGIAFEQMKSEQ
jgi:hypothetical protein